MNASYERGIILYRQNRYMDAEQEFHKALAAEPDNAASHGMLALCACFRRQFSRAKIEARQVLSMAPNLPFAHYVQAVVLNNSGDIAAAKVEAAEAIRLEPNDAESLSLMSLIYANLRDWKGAIDAADRGLEVDPRHVRCLNRRATALLELRRPDEAIDTSREALALEPNDPAAHSNLGWALLQKVKPDEAMDHFLEALRAAPGSELARNGFVESVKARHFVYRTVLRALLLPGRLPKAAWVFLAIAGPIAWIVVQIETEADWMVLAFPAVFASFLLFLAIGPFTKHAFTLVVRLHPLGRHAISNRQKASSNAIAAFILAAVSAMVIGLLTGRSMPTMIVAGIFLFGIPAGYYWPLRREPRGRRVLVFAIVSFLLGTVAVVERLAGAEEVKVALAGVLYFFYTVLCIISPRIE